MIWTTKYTTYLYICNFIPIVSSNTVVTFCWKYGYIEFYLCKFFLFSYFCFPLISAGNPAGYSNGTWTQYMDYCFVQKIKRLVALGNLPFNQTEWAFILHMLK